MKYTVLVVDDEFELRRALIEKVDWQSAGFEVIGEAENGIEALECIESLEPDLIITDIKMPMISGLELAKRIREIRPAAQIVILSGYDSFEYARTAIEYNIISYLLKPISSSEMTEELKNIRAKMDEKILNAVKIPDPDLKRQLKKAETEEFLLPLMLGGSENKTDEEQLILRAKQLGIIKGGGENLRFCVMVVKFKDIYNKTCTTKKHTDFLTNILSKYFTCETLIVFSRAVVLAVLNEDGKLSNVLELSLKETVQSAKRLLDQSCTIGVSREFYKLSDCSDAYFQAVTAR